MAVSSNGRSNSSLAMARSRSTASWWHVLSTLSFEATPLATTPYAGIFNSLRMTFFPDFLSEQVSTAPDTNNTYPSHCDSSINPPHSFLNIPTDVQTSSFYTLFVSPSEAIRQYCYAKERSGVYGSSPSAGDTHVDVCYPIVFAISHTHIALTAIQGSAPISTRVSLTPRILRVCVLQQFLC